MAMAPYDLLRTFGGALFLLGVLICVANTLATFRQRRAREQVHATMAAEERDAEAALQPEKLSMGLVARIIVAASTGGIVEIAPLFTIQRTVEIPADLRRRRRWNWGARSTCARAAIACHSQMIRTPADKIDRHGPYSVAGESAWDFPMPWGSKRRGPDIA